MSEEEENSPPQKLKKHYDQKYSALWKKDKNYAGWITVMVCTAGGARKWRSSSATSERARCRGAIRVMARRAAHGGHTARARLGLGGTPPGARPSRRGRLCVRESARQQRSGPSLPYWGAAPPAGAREPARPRRGAIFCSPRAASCRRRRPHRGLDHTRY
ncbi:hypothetical protein NQ318_015343 [Aromia moschata]|uniref:Uncharacterized protein n=1 Tax=Aromia moschata TaxID=1265417 RepID=A0AAV8YNU3_9CUCU|nr:hypothetical protein NQ318_015343 [Aromia moschata]